MGVRVRSGNQAQHHEECIVVALRQGNRTRPRAVTAQAKTKTENKPADDIGAVTQRLDMEPDETETMHSKDAHHAHENRAEYDFENRKVAQQQCTHKNFILPDATFLQQESKGDSEQQSEQTLVRLHLSFLILRRRGGWSYGALEMLSYVKQFGSERLSGLVMIDSPPKSTGVDNLNEWVWYRYDDADGSQEYFTLGPVRNRDKFNKEFAQWMLVDPTPERIRWVTDIANHTSDTVAGMLNAAGIFLNFTDELKSLEGKMPLLYTVRGEVKDVVTSWAKQNTPSATVEAFGSHLLFWEFHERYNQVLENYLRLVTATMPAVPAPTIKLRKVKDWKKGETNSE